MTATIVQPETQTETAQAPAQEIAKAPTPISVPASAPVAAAQPAPASTKHTTLSDVLGKVFGLLILADEAYILQNQPGHSPATLLEPQNLNALLTGALTVLNTSAK